MKISVLKAARKKRGLTQIQLANEIGVSPSTVAGWELGTHGIRSDKLPTLAKVLRRSVNALVG